MGALKSYTSSAIISASKKAVRVVTNSAWNSHTNPIFVHLHILPLEQLNKFQSACFVYKVLHNMLPKTFMCVFTYCSQIHNYNTRQRTNLHTIQHRTKTRANSIRVYGVNLWNSLDCHIKEAQSLSIFRNRLKYHYLTDL